MDFDEASDSIHKESLWANIGEEWHSRQKLRVKMVKVFHDSFKCAVVDRGEIYEWFKVKTGIKQGCNNYVWNLVLDRNRLGDEKHSWKW